MCQVGNKRLLQAEGPRTADTRNASGPQLSWLGVFSREILTRQDPRQCLGTATAITTRGVLPSSGWGQGCCSAPHGAQGAPPKRDPAPMPTVPRGALSKRGLRTRGSESVQTGHTAQYTRWRPAQGGGGAAPPPTAERRADTGSAEGAPSPAL